MFGCISQTGGGGGGAGGGVMFGPTSQHLLTNRLHSALDQKDKVLSDYSCNYAQSHQNTRRRRRKEEGGV